MFGMNIFFEAVMLNSNILLKIVINLVDFMKGFLLFYSLETEIYLYF